MVDAAPAALPCEQQACPKQLSLLKDRAALSVKLGEATGAIRSYWVSRHLTRLLRLHSRERRLLLGFRRQDRRPRRGM